MKETNKIPPILLNPVFIAVIWGFLLFFSGNRHIYEIETSYEAEWDGPFFTILLGKIGGYLPAKFNYHEKVWKNRRGMEDFFMALDDADGKAWMRINSDPKEESAVWLPRKPKDILNPDAIRFVRGLRRLFEDTALHKLNGTFTFSRKKLIAEVREYAPTFEEFQKFKSGRAFTILTFDTTGRPGIGGRVVSIKDTIMRYKKVIVNLPHDEIEVVLEDNN